MDPVSTITVPVSIEIHALLASLEQLETPVLEDIYSRLGSILKNRHQALQPSVALSTANDDKDAESVEMAATTTIPIVAKLIPASLTFNGDELSF